MPEPWDRQPGEPRIAHAAFQEYLRLGPLRTFAELARRLNRTLGNYSQMSARWRWPERAAEYDRHVAARDEVRFAVIRAEAERVRQQRELVRREMCWRTAERLIERVNQMLDVPLEQTTWNYGQLCQLAFAAGKLAQAAVQSLNEADQQVGGQLIAGQFKLYRDDDGEDRAVPELKNGVSVALEEDFKLDAVPTAELVGPKAA